MFLERVRHLYVAGDPPIKFANDIVLAPGRRFLGLINAG